MKKTDDQSKKTAEQLLKEAQAEALRKQLALSPDLLIQEKGSDKSLERRIEKITLINGNVLYLSKIRKYIDDKINAYEKKFGQDFYREVFRLNGWTIPKDGIIRQKPSIVGQFTNDIIYGRFPKEVLAQLQDSNKWDEQLGMRPHKHYNLLNPVNSDKVDEYIKQSIAIMKRCKFWDEFVAEHAKVYGHPFQTSLFN